MTRRCERRRSGCSFSARPPHVLYVQSCTIRLRRGPPQFPLLSQITLHILCQIKIRTSSSSHRARNRMRRKRNGAVLGGRCRVVPPLCAFNSHSLTISFCGLGKPSTPSTPSTPARWPCRSRFIHHRLLPPSQHQPLFRAECLQSSPSNNTGFIPPPYYTTPAPSPRACLLYRLAHGGCPAKKTCAITATTAAAASPPTANGNTRFPDTGCPSTRTRSAMCIFFPRRCYF